MPKTNPNFNNIIFVKFMYKLYDNVCEAFDIGVNTYLFTHFFFNMKYRILRLKKWTLYR